jgi:hypothetical protein
MKTIRMILAAVLAACAAAAATSAAAQAQGRFTCGGVGVGEQDRMKAEASQHDLMLIFSSPTGAYVADVDVRIADAQGRVVVQGRCGGPLMLADLGGKGSYEVTATFEGRTQRKKVSVGAKPARLSFVWPVS